MTITKRIGLSPIAGIAIATLLLAGWAGTAEAQMLTWTGFHFPSPTNDHWRSDRAKVLLDRADRWGAVVLAYACDNCQDAHAVYALDRVREARIANGGGDSLDQTVLRLYWGAAKPTFLDFGSADAWVRRYYVPTINYFVTRGGRLVQVFNEPEVSGEPTYDIDRRTLGLISQALRNAYWNGGNRLVYTLFPGPGALKGFGPCGNWIYCFEDFWHKYDMHDGAHQPLTFNQVFGSVDGWLSGKKMLYHGGTGVFDGIALHAYEDDPGRFMSTDPNTNRALAYLEWTKNSVDNSGSVYVTESSGNPRSFIQSNCDDSGMYMPDDWTSGRALAWFERAANDRYRLQWPYFLKAVYGYTLQYTNCASNNNGWHSIGPNYIDGYNYGRGEKGF